MNYRQQKQKKEFKQPKDKKKWGIYAYQAAPNYFNKLSITYIINGLTTNILA